MKFPRLTKAAAGLTLIELMIAVGLFAGLMVVTAALFSRSLERQNETIISKDLQEEVSFALQYIKKEMSGAQADLANCGSCSGETYFCAPSEDTLFFRNAQGTCTQYSVAAPVAGIGQFAVSQNDNTYYLTSEKVNISGGMKFTTDAVTSGTLDRAVVTFSLAFRPSAKPNFKPLNIQSSLTVPLSSFACGNNIIDRDGFSYATAQIGTQCWMAQSLRTKSKPNGECINGGSAPCPDASGADSGLGRLCYENDEANCTNGGALYLWEAAMNGSVTPGDVGICPTGWHVPTDAEWHTLEDGLKTIAATCDGGRVNASDCDDAGIKLSVVGDSGFEGILAGYSDAIDSFKNLGDEAYYTTSSEIDGSTYYAYSISSATTVLRLSAAKATMVLSLRCIKD